MVVKDRWSLQKVIVKTGLSVAKYERWKKVLGREDVKRLFTTLFSVQNVKRVHCLCPDVPRQVSLLSCQDILIFRTCLDHNCSVKEKVDIKMF